MPKGEGGLPIGLEVAAREIDVEKTFKIKTSAINKMANVIIDPGEINLEEDLTEKLDELRAKRDAISLHHEDLKRDNDSFNKVIICLSLFTGFFETLKGQLELNNSPNDAIRNGSAIAPIFLSTLVGIISSLLKFKKYPERMEELTKASEKANFSITRIRELKQILNFEDHGVIKNTYTNEVLSCYRDSLEIIEKSLYPDVRQSYYEKAQANLLQIGKNSKDFKNDIQNLSAPNLIQMKTARPKVIYPPV